MLDNLFHTHIILLTKKNSNIRQGWEASLPDVGLSKTLRIRPAPHAANSKEDNT